MLKTIFYIDGFNLYFGLRSAKLKKYYWLDIQKLSIELLNNDEELVKVKYFTARISEPPDKQQRQSTYIQAIETLSLVSIYYGLYQNDKVKCSNCNQFFKKPNEKRTDVNITCQMIMDAFYNHYDVAKIVSGDSDLVPLIETISQMFPNKKVEIYFPPKRESYHLANIGLADCFTITPDVFGRCQLPEELPNKYRYIIGRPSKWR